MSCLYSIDEKLLCGRPFRQLLQNFVMRDGLADNEGPPHAMQLGPMLRLEGGEGNGNPPKPQCVDGSVGIRSGGHIIFLHGPRSHPRNPTINLVGSMFSRVLY